jgi:isopenicillin-N epimerase
VSDSDLLPDDVWAGLRGEFDLAPGVAYLNHGSFGPPPRAVVKAQQAVRNELNADPMRFFVRRWDALFDEAAERVGRFVGTNGRNLVFLPNATAAMNVVAASCELQPGDEVLANNHEYGAVLRTWERRTADVGARIVTARLPEPIESHESIVESIFAAVTHRTRLIVVSHVTSPTAVILPVAEICRRAERQGISVCIDGPHALAMLDVRLDELGCDFYCASGHKWLSAPFGSGFLFVHPRRQNQMLPLVTSWGKRTPSDVSPRWTDEFRWSGTTDPSAYLAMPAAIEFFERVGLDAFRRHTHALAREARSRIESLTGLPALVPDDASWYGPMITLPLPPGDGPALQRELAERFQIEGLIVSWNDRRFIRPSFHLYNAPEDLDRLTVGLKALLAEGE